jgi:hypothetical protein
MPYSSFLHVSILVLMKADLKEEGHFHEFKAILSGNFLGFHTHAYYIRRFSSRKARCGRLGKR